MDRNYLMVRYGDNAKKHPWAVRAHRLGTYGLQAIRR
jgi:hypothetical protein